MLNPIICNLLESHIDVFLNGLSIIFRVFEYQTVIEQNYDQLIDIFAIHSIDRATVVQFVQKLLLINHLVFGHEISANVVHLQQ
jgi:hypothetical protein